MAMVEVGTNSFLLTVFRAYNVSYASVPFLNGSSSGVEERISKSIDKGDHSPLYIDNRQ